ncbi:MAG: hypothetical protein HKO53_09035 [Gemmatimonadetes bacterium]|nr:hypothetical protein [Gemmatimonadota bacterium]
MLPSAVGYVLFGEEIMGAVFRTGAFGADDAVVGGWVLAAYALGLPASGVSRVLSSSFYALRDTRTPASIAYVRIVVSGGVGAALMVPFDDFVIGGLGLGAAGLGLGAATGAWLEWGLLRRSLGSRLGGLGPGLDRNLRRAAALFVASALGLGLRTVLPETGSVVRGILVVGPFALTYLVLTHWMNVSRLVIRPGPNPGGGPTDEVTQ